MRFSAPINVAKHYGRVPMKFAIMLRPPVVGAVSTQGVSGLHGRPISELVSLFPVTGRPDASSFRTLTTQEMVGCGPIARRQRRGSAISATLPTSVEAAAAGDLLPPAEVEARLTTAANLINTSEKLVVYNPEAANMGCVIW